MRKNVLLMSLMALFLFGCSTSETNDLDLVDDTVILSESKSVGAKGIENAPGFSGKVVREVLDIGFVVLDEESNLTALFGWDTEILWPPVNMEFATYQWNVTALGQGELGALVFAGTPDWPWDGDCNDCDVFFDGASPVATGTSKFTYHENMNSFGGRFHGRLMTQGGDMVNLSAWFDWFKGEFNESVILK